MINGNQTGPHGVRLPSSHPAQCIVNVNEATIQVQNNDQVASKSVRQSLSIAVEDQTNYNEAQLQSKEHTNSHSASNSFRQSSGISAQTNDIQLQEPCDRSYLYGHVPLVPTLKIINTGLWQNRALNAQPDTNLGNEIIQKIMTDVTNNSSPTDIPQSVSKCLEKNDLRKDSCKRKRS